MLETPNALQKSVTLAGASAGLPKEVALHGLLQEFARERTFENLSASLGEDKAKSVITSIGMAALSAAPELNGAGLGAVVTQTLARLTQEELAGISRNESSAVGRVQAIVQEEVKAQRNAQAPVNLHGAASAHAIAQGDLRGIGAAFGASNRESSARFSNMKEASAADQAASNFANQIGADPAYAKLFVGASPESLRALSDFIRNGKPANDNDIHTIKDAQAWIGAIRAGKVDPNDPNLPPAIKKIIQGMKDEGIDPATADPKQIKDYFEKHPKALEAAKKQAQADIKKQEGLTAAQQLQKQEQAKTPRADAKAAEDKKPNTQVAAKSVKKTEGTLGL